MRKLVVLGALACVVAPVAGDASAREARPADPRLIVFQRNGSLWSIRPDGTQLRRFLDRNRGQNGQRPVLSPDRSLVLFDGNPPAREPSFDNFNLYLIRPDGTGLRTVTSWPNWETDPQWLPNGRIGFVRTPTGGLWRRASIWTMRADGSDATRLFAGLNPRWSPDGRRVAFAMATRTSDLDLFVANADGSGRRQLTRTRVVEAPNGWSRDGRKILFSRARRLSPSENDPSDIFVVNADGSRPRKLAAGIACCFSPDGRRILYHSNARRLFVMNANGSGTRRISPFGPVFDPHWR